MHEQDLARRLAEAEATIAALIAGQIDAVVDPDSPTPVLLTRAQAALRESEAAYRQIVETTSDGILKVDQEARIVFVNERLGEMLGYDPDQLVGMSVYDLMDAATRPVVAASIAGRLRGVKEPVDTTMLHRTGTRIEVNIAGSAIVDGEGRYVGNLAVVRDFTEQKKLRAQLSVSDRMASVGTLAAGVAHEINNPLAAVIANIDCIAEALRRARSKSATWMPEEVQGPLDDAREAAERVRFIVRDLKLFSGTRSADPRGPVDVNATMESSLRMAWNEIRHRARLVKDYGVVPGVLASEPRLGQVFVNLLINAAQSVPEGGADRSEIRIVTRLEGSRVIVEVKDTGEGIPPDLIDRIFDPFFTTKAVGVGTGLGLSICQRIVIDIGGELTVESVVGRGTTFRVSLPKAPDDESAVPSCAAPVAITARRGRILVVDDEEVLLRTLKRVLGGEHDVVALQTAGAALALCAAGEKFDLILCDLMMPLMTGMDLHGELSRVAPDQADRMIFLTGGAFTEGARRFLSEPPKEHIEKPFDRANLLAIVQRHLR